MKGGNGPTSGKEALDVEDDELLCYHQDEDPQTWMNQVPHPAHWSTDFERRDDSGEIGGHPALPKACGRAWPWTQKRTARPAGRWPFVQHEH